MQWVHHHRLHFAEYVVHMLIEIVWRRGGSSDISPYASDC